MEPLFAITFGALVAMAIYLVLSRNVLRMILGLLLLGNATNLSIFVAGRIPSATPPLVEAGQTAIQQSANPLPQALILTAIVISFALVAFTTVLFQNAYQSLGTLDTEEMRDAEAPEQGEELSIDTEDEVSA